MPDLEDSPRPHPKQRGGNLSRILHQPQEQMWGHPPLHKPPEQWGKGTRLRVGGVCQKPVRLPQEAKGTQDVEIKKEEGRPSILTSLIFHF